MRSRELKVGSTARRRWRRPLLGGAGLASGIYLVVVAGVWWSQEALLFHPGRSRVPPAAWQHALETGAQELSVPVADGDVTLRGLLLVAEASGSAPRPTVIYFGGNASALHPETTVFDRIRSRGMNVALVAYRGYGRSEGRPTGDALLVDALAVYDAVSTLEEVDPEAIAVWGRSLGSGVATFVAAERPARAAVLVSPYTRLSDAAAFHYPWLPVRWLFRNEIDSVANATRVNQPVLVFHGTSDRVVPFSLGERLVTDWPSARLIPLENVGHGPELSTDERFPEDAVDFLAEQLGLDGP